VLEMLFMIAAFAAYHLSYRQRTTLMLADAGGHKPSRSLGSKQRRKQASIQGQLLMAVHVDLLQLMSRVHSSAHGNILCLLYQAVVRQVTQTALRLMTSLASC